MQYDYYVSSLRAKIQGADRLQKRGSLRNWLEVLVMGSFKLSCIMLRRSYKKSFTHP